MNEPDFLTHAVGQMLRYGASAETVGHFRRLYTRGATSAQRLYPCPLCFLNFNQAEYMAVASKQPTSKHLKCASCDYEITVTAVR